MATSFRSDSSAERLRIWKRHFISSAGVATVMLLFVCTFESCTQSRYTRNTDSTISEGAGVLCVERLSPVIWFRLNLSKADTESRFILRTKSFSRVNRRRHRIQFMDVVRNVFLASGCTAQHARLIAGAVIESPTDGGVVDVVMMSSTLSKDLLRR